MDGGACLAEVHGVAKSQTRLSVFTFTFHFHVLKKEMATHSSVLAWRIPWMEEPGGLPSMGLHRVGHNWSGLAAAATAGHGRTGKETQYVAARGVTKSWIWLSHWKIAENRNSNARVGKNHMDLSGEGEGGLHREIRMTYKHSWH